MALTFRDNKGSALSHTEMDSNFRYFTGSFTNVGTITATAFAGDGSAITGVTGEWDGSHNGNASITGSLTVTSDISSSGNITADEITCKEYHIVADSHTEFSISGSNATSSFNLTNENTAGAIVINTAGSGDIFFGTAGNTTEYRMRQGGHLWLTGAAGAQNISASGDIFGNRIWSNAYITAGSHLNVTNDINANGNIVGDEATNIRGILNITASGNISASGEFIGASAYITNITASGDISASGDIYGVTGSFSHVLGASPLTIESDNFNVDSSGNISASGDLSIEGGITSSLFKAGDNVVGTGLHGIAVKGNISASGNIVGNDIYSNNTFYATGHSGYEFRIYGNNFNMKNETTNMGLFFKTTGTGKIQFDTDNGVNTIICGDSSTNSFLIDHGIDITPTYNGYGHFIIQGSGYEGYISLDNEAMYIGGNSAWRDTVLQTNRADAITIDGGNQNVHIEQALSKTTGAFRINHPLITGSYLYHSFIEGPKADLIYRGQINLVDGVGNVNIDSVSNMTEGTFVALTQDPQLFFQNTTGWEPLKGNISENVLSIECKSTSSVDTVSWMVVAERADDFIKDWNLTDDDGHLIPEWPISGSE
jgi:hypothetical protein